ncbi:polymorphic toxin-type HINT domain-containing protein [Cytophagaceae bacterium YF14B1]|uniref:Polymorphic toxin-type HINT domain-containing protein n=1 Tax=Xanthocytophaga flava TaxID=3048013 RepID=A0AAE3QUU1_9BACT|nr:polymorphic toxin-type HINT domain-containing protein [Xanthocytophaga flavus]MDJ1482963.1 polymorphic toxin-type HINT domain-containing protein [Xanthocytophaga flavus]
MVLRIKEILILFVGFWISALANPCLAFTLPADSLYKEELRQFEDFLRHTHEQEKKGIYGKGQYIFSAGKSDSKVPLLSDNPINTGKWFFSEQAGKEVEEQLEAFHKKQDKVKVFVCTGRYYLPEMYMPDEVEVDMKALADLNKQKDNPKLIEKTFRSLQFAHLQLLEREYPGEKKIVLFGIELIRTAITITPDGNGPAKPSASIYGESEIVVDRAFKSAWQVKKPKVDLWQYFNGDRSEWLRSSIADILAGSELYLSGFGDYGVIAKQWINFSVSTKSSLSFLGKLMERLGSENPAQNLMKNTGKLVYDFAKVLDSDEQDLNKLLAENTQLPVRVITTDWRTSQADKKAIDDYITSLPNSVWVFWIDFTKESTIEARYLVLNNGLQVDYATKNQLGKLLINTIWERDMGSYAKDMYRFYFVQSVNMWADLISHAKIPEKYYNPKHEQYTDILYVVFQFTGVSVVTFSTPLEKLLVSAGVTDIDFSQFKFAVVCGFYNGFINLLESLPRTAASFADFIIDWPEKEEIKAFFDGITKLMAKCVGDNKDIVHLIYMATDQLNPVARGLVQLEGFALIQGKCIVEAFWKMFVTCDGVDCNAYQIGAKIGSFAFDVVTFVVPILAATKGTKIAVFLNFLDELDVFSQLLRASGLALRVASSGIRGAYVFGKGFMRISWSDAKKYFQLLNSEGQVLNELSSLRHSVVTDKAGKSYTVIENVPTDDNSTRPTRIQTLLTDADGTVQTDADGYGIARLDNGNEALVDISGKSLRLVTNLSSVFGLLKDTYSNSKKWLQGLGNKLHVYSSGADYTLSYVDNTHIEKDFATITSKGDLVAKRMNDNPTETVEVIADGRILPPNSQEPIDGFGLTRDRNGNLGCSGGFCFVASTPVWVSESGQTRPIGDLQVGEKVLAQRVSSGETGLQKIVSISRNQVSRLVRILVGKDTIWSTVTHPFVGADGKTISAGNLRKGIWLRKAVASVMLASSSVFVPEAQAVAVDSVAIVDTSATVYNLKVEQFDAYLVGQQGMVVLMACDIQRVFKNLNPKLAEKLKDLKDFDQLLANSEVVKAIEGLDTKRDLFLENLLSQNPNVKPVSNLLTHHVSEIDPQMIDVWKLLDENNNTHKKMDFEFLKDNRGKTKTEILEAVKKENDKEISLVVKAGSTTNLAKSLDVLETTEPTMSQALRDAFEKGDRTIFKDEVVNKLKMLLDKDYIGTKTMVSQVRAVMIKDFNEKMGEVLSFDELMKITEKVENGGIGLVSQQGSRGSMFESWFEKNFTEKLGLQGKYSGTFDGDQFVIDCHYFRVVNNSNYIIGVELKHIDGLLSGEPFIQLERYAKMIKDRLNTRIVRIEYVFSKFDVANSNKAIIKQVFDDVQLPNAKGTLYEIYYIKNGESVKIN